MEKEEVVMAFKVLLIDDEPLALEGLQILLNWGELGFEVCGTCENGLQGLKLMEELKPDLVMVDIHMPKIDGLQMIEEWRNKGNHSTKFIILTGYSDFGYARKALKYRVSRYLLKPLDEEQAQVEIGAILKELIEEKKQFHIGEVAQREKELFLVKDLLLGKPLNMEDEMYAGSLSLQAEIWNVCLVQVPKNQLVRVSEIAKEFLEGLYTVYFIHLRMDYFSIVFGNTARQNEKEDVWDKIQKLACRLAGFRVFMAVGQPERSLMHIRNCYLTATEALLHAFYETEENGIVSYNKIEKLEFQTYFKQVELLERIIKSLQLIDHGSYQETVNHIEQTFRDIKVHPDEAHKFVIYILHEIKMYLSGQIEKESESSSRLFDIPDLNETLITFDDLIGMLRSYGRVCFDLLLKENTIESQGIVQEINEYIMTHYREGLTIKMLAERFFLHPAYLGQLLMRKNGIGFNELLHDLRIEEACRLLRTNQYKNSEVSEMMGYTSYNHFLKQFEKRIGISPNEYKKT